MSYKARHQDVELLKLKARLTAGKGVFRIALDETDLAKRD